MTFFDQMKKLLRDNIRDYGMYIAFVVIITIFSIATKGLFLSSRNIVNLLNATSYIAIMAVGMTLVIVIRHIDLQVGWLLGFLGAIAATALKYWNVPVYLVIPLVMVIGICAGLITGFLVAKMKIPAFVATLAGWLAYHGALQLVTRGTGTISISDKFFNAIGNGFIPDIPGLTHFLPGIHKLTLILGLMAIALFVISTINNRKTKMSYNFEVLPMNMFVVQLLLVGTIISLITWVLAGYQGLSWASVVLFVVVIIYHFITTRTVIGRHVYAVGGNPEAAELSGISVKKITYIVFASMGVLTAISAVVYASWMRSATTLAGSGLELDVIAATFVGGTSVSGGVGKITGSIVGALVMASLVNGMNLLGMDISYQYLVRAAVLAAAVIFDVATRNRGK